MPSEFRLLHAFSLPTGDQEFSNSYDNFFSELARDNAALKKENDDLKKSAEIAKSNVE